MTDGVVRLTAMDQTNTPSGPRLVQTLIPMGTLSGDGVIVGALSVGGEVMAGGGTADAGKVIAGMAAAVGYGVEVGGREVTTGVVVSRASTVGVLVGAAILAVVGTAVLSVGEVAIMAVEAVGKIA